MHVDYEWKHSSVSFPLTGTGPFKEKPTEAMHWFIVVIHPVIESSHAIRVVIGRVFCKPPENPVGLPYLGQVSCGA